MRDLPEGPALLAFARDVLLDELLPLLPPERRLDARFIANCMAIAVREAEAGPETKQEIADELTALYGGAVAPDPLHRFARDLRKGAFENSEPQAAAARAILWRMTIERLCLANPRFLAANGLAGSKG